MDTVFVYNESEYIGKGVVLKTTSKKITPMISMNIWHILITEGPYANNIAVSTYPIDEVTFDTTTVMLIPQWEKAYK